jgi:hypothetical protein
MEIRYIRLSKRGGQYSGRKWRTAAKKPVFRFGVKPRFVNQDLHYNTYDVQSGELFSKTIAEGEKEIGGRYDKFELALTLNKKLFTTNGDQTNSMLEVLKTEKSKDEFNRDVVLVWFKVNCTFYSTIDTSSFVLKDGYLLADFMYNL